MDEFDTYQMHDIPTLSKKQTTQLNQMRICNCPCVQQIQQNQRMIELQRQYTKTLQLQNLRRNQERIYLQAQVSQLKLQLQQPHKQREQLKSQLSYLKKLIESKQLKMNDLQSLYSIKDLEISQMSSQLIKVNNQNQKLNLQLTLANNNVEELKIKLNQMYIKLKGTIFPGNRERKASFMINKSEESVDDIFQKINKKWESYNEQLQQKYSTEAIKMESKYKNQLEIMKNKIIQLEQAIMNKKQQLQFLSIDKENLKHKTLQSQKQIQSYRLIKDSQVENFVKSSKIKLQEKIILLQEEVNQLKLENSLKSQEIQQKSKILQLAQKQKLTSKAKFLTSIQMQTNQIQLNVEQNQQFKLLQTKYQQSNLIIKQKNQQLFKLEQKVLSLQKTRELFNQKQKQLILHREKYQSSSINQNKRVFLNKNQEMEQLLRKILNDESLKTFITNSLLKQYYRDLNQLKAKYVITQQQLQQKIQQIISLEEVNSSLKKMKIDSLQHQSKISMLQKQNHQLRKQIGLSNHEKIDFGRATKSNVGKSGFCRSNATSKAKDIKDYYKKSLIQVQAPNRHDRSYFTCKNSQTGKSRESNDSETPSDLLDIILGKKTRISNDTKYNLKVQRHDTFESEDKHSKKVVNFCLQVPDQAKLQMKSETEQKINFEITFNE